MDNNISMGKLPVVWGELRNVILDVNIAI